MGVSNTRVGVSNTGVGVRVYLDFSAEHAVQHEGVCARRALLARPEQLVVSRYRVAGGVPGLRVFYLLTSYWSESTLLSG